MFDPGGVWKVRRVVKRVRGGSRGRCLLLIGEEVPKAPAGEEGVVETKGEVIVKKSVELVMVL